MIDGVIGCWNGVEKFLGLWWVMQSFPILGSIDFRHIGAAKNLVAVSLWGIVARVRLFAIVPTFQSPCRVSLWQDSLCLRVVCVGE